MPSGSIVTRMQSYTPVPCTDFTSARWSSNYAFSSYTQRKEEEEKNRIIPIG